LGYWRLIVHQAPRARGISLAVHNRIQDGLGTKAYVGVTPMLANYEGMLRGRYFIAGVFVLLGAASLLLAAAGLFSVLSYAVSQRTREFAVRIALGARTEDVLRLVLRDGLELALGGTAVGALVGMWAGTLLTKWLYDVHPADVTALVAAETVLLAVTLLSCLVPAVRAMRADPVEVLRAT
jgi:ABC-type antimicrobial peptide transport system permease subunit